MATVIASLKSLDIALLHFMRPELLWALPIVLALWLLLRSAAGSHRWEQYIPKEMVAALQVNATRQSGLWRYLLLLIWVLLIVSAAGPTWQKQSAPVVENQRAVVLVLDLSPSMLAQDLNPDRLTRAKYKLIDVIRQLKDGQMALVAYAGDAHTVSPLSDDPKTIEALLPALHPNIMPSRGSNVEAGIELAMTLLRDAGASSGEIILITDGVVPSAIKTIRGQVGGIVKRLSVLGVGSTQAAPIPQADGGFVRDAQGEIILTAVNSAELADLANSLSGQYLQLSADSSDVTALLSDDIVTELGSTTGATASDKLALNQLDSSLRYDAWTDMGYLLAILILPLLLLLFRRGLVYLLPVFIFLPNQADAAQLSWTDLWKTPDQQAAELFEKGEFDQASAAFKDPHWRAAAHYRSRDYASAIDQLDGQTDPQSIYNKGNALALNGDREAAIEAYTKVLEAQPDHQDAAFNKQLLEKMSEQDSQDQEGDDQEGEGQKGEGQDSEGQNDESGEQGESEQESQSGESKSKDSQSPQAGEESDQQPSPADNPRQEPADQQPPAETDNGQDSSSDPAPADSESAEQQDQDESTEGDQQPSDSQEGEGEGSEQDPATQGQDGSESGDEESDTALGQIEEGPAPLDDASEQWLRSIQDDPSGLLRRKFEYQAEQRRASGAKPANDQNQRY